MSEDVSADQQQWQEIAAAVRAQLARAVAWVPAMNPGEVASLVSALREAMWFEIHAASFDADREAYLRQTERQGMFGG